MRPRVQLGVDVPTRDGCALATDVVLPTTRPVGAVVVRTPYGRGNHTAEGLHWAARGIAFVCQDVRGRHDSTGEWVPFRHERADAGALLDWLSRQGWCPDRVVASGSSYAAGTAWAVAAEDSAGLVTGVVSKVPVLGTDRVKRDPSGIVRLAEHLSWWGEHGASRGSRPGYVSAALHTDPRLFEHLPVTGLADRIGLSGDAGWMLPFHRATAAEPYGSDDCVPPEELAALDVAGLHIGGWFDDMVDETIRHAEVVGSALVTRPPQSVLIGPWDHRMAPPRTTAAPSNVGPRDPASAQVRWITDTLAGSPPRWNDLYDMGTGRWSTAVPEDRAPTTTRWVGTTAGSLVPRRDVDDDTDSRPMGFDHHPLRPDEGRLVWTSPPLSRPLRVWGRPVLTLDVRTDTEADWVACVDTESVGGERSPVATGCRSTRAAGRVRIPLTEVRRTLCAGDRIVLTLSGADFPRLARNLGASDRYTGTSASPTNQGISCGGTDPVPALDLPLTEPEHP
ncbi:CocE/NonD family hydrolase [Rhodococcus triatomae]|nr:hydrolase [Rhodococcus triatomae BKS 15-14]